MNDYPPTPVLTDHARERCAEMGIPAKLAKRIWRNRTLTRGLHDQHRVIATCADHPDYSLVVDDTGEVPVIITVLFTCVDKYTREGTTYRVKRAS